MSYAHKAESTRAIPADDPILAALRRAPVGPPMTEDERRAMDEADELGRSFLHEAGLSSRGMADFFERMAEGEIDTPAQVAEVSEWWMTHPNTDRRIQAARAAERDGAPALSAADWATLRQSCSSDEAETGGQPWGPIVIERRPRNDPMPSQSNEVGQD